VVSPLAPIIRAARWMGGGGVHRWDELPAEKPGLDCKSSSPGCQTCHARHVALDGLVSAATADRTGCHYRLPALASVRLWLQHPL
jgi:hypothetical protein